MVGWITFSAVFPILTFANKFGLFKESTLETDELGNVIESPTLALNGWGIIACIILGFTISSIVKEVIAAYPTYSLAKQCFTGVLKTIIPLATGYAACYFLNGVITHIMYCLGVILLCQIAAIPLNPLPKWRYEKAGVEDYNSLLTSFTKIVKKELNKKE